MRPTPEEILANPDLFVQLLEAQGVKNAQARVSAIAYDMLEYSLVQKQQKRDGRFIRTNEQYSYRYPQSDSATNKYDVLRRVKKTGSYRTSYLHYDQYLKRKMKKIQAKINKWPELTWDPKTLKTAPSTDLMKKYVLRRTSRRSVTTS